MFTGKRSLDTVHAPQAYAATVVATRMRARIAVWRDIHATPNAADGEPPRPLPQPLWLRTTGLDAATGFCLYG